MMKRGGDNNEGLIHQLCGRGFSFYASVPCSYLKTYIAEAAQMAEDGHLVYVSALREDIALGVACGAYFAGKKAVVMMQNSGFGASVNTLASVVCAFGIPLLMLVTVRGCGENDSPENSAMGRITGNILKMLDIPTKILDEMSMEDMVAWADDIICKEGRSASILIPCAPKGK